MSADGETQRKSDITMYNDALSSVESLIYSNALLLFLCLNVVFQRLSFFCPIITYGGPV